jgi:transposase InsO family protein
VSTEKRIECLGLIKDAQAEGASKAKSCDLLGLSVRTAERWATRPTDLRQGPRTKPANAFTEDERQVLLSVANSAEFANLPPGQIVPRLADRGEYIGSESSFYRTLKAMNMLVHRARAQPRKHTKPEALVAMGPNQIWSWDITYLRAAIRGMYYYLYLPMDIFSRFIVHWEVHERENSDEAAEMIETACQKEGITKNQIKLHSDNGGPMKGATMLATLQKLGVAPSFSRPSVSDDNPYSESLFKTLKYCPSFPEKGFASIEEARAWVEQFVHWYNHIHRHSGINWVTPASRHKEKDQEVLTNRSHVYEFARKKNPTRWSKKTRNWSRPTTVELNPGRNKSTDKKIIPIEQAA